MSSEELSEITAICINSGFIINLILAEMILLSCWKPLMTSVIISDF